METHETSKDLIVKYDSLKQEWGELEKKLIDKIGATGNEELMNLFLDWQNLRGTLNETVLQCQKVMRQEHLTELKELTESHFTKRIEIASQAPQKT